MPMGIARTQIDPGSDGRLNLLLSAATWRNEGWVDVLAGLLEPMGVRALRATSGRQATELIKQAPIHIAVVDLALPLNDAADADTTSEEGGRRILDLLARLEEPPPTVIVKRRRTRREDARDLASALQCGAFAVMEAPVHPETALEVMRRVLCRHYADRWPGSDCGPAARGSVRRMTFRFEQRRRNHPGDGSGDRREDDSS
jgi:CheY-like chemotaxis protein